MRKSIPYGRQWIDKHDKKAVLKALNSDLITQGPRVKEFEKKIAGYCGAKYAVAVSNGTSALHLSYLAAGIGKGDEVITTPNTFAATSNMILAVGARPVFCDIRLDTNNINEKEIEKLISPETKAIVPVHFAGHSCELDAIYKIAKKHNLVVIEDACHALGARYKKSVIGDCRYSDMAVFSFHPVKSITTAEGGIITTNNGKYYRDLLLLRSHGIEKDENGFNVMHKLGFNYRMTELQAALGISQLKKLEKFIDARRKRIPWYHQELKDVSQILLPVELGDNRSSWHIFVIRIKNSRDRMSLYKHLLKNKIRANFHYPCVYNHPYYQKNGFGNTTNANAEIYEKTAITLPLYPSLGRQEVKYISGVIRQYFKKTA